MKTIKEIALKLGISISKAYQIKKEIENEIGAPPHMVWGTGFNKNFTLSAFKNRLK